MVSALTVCKRGRGGLLRRDFHLFSHPVGILIAPSEHRAAFQSSAAMSKGGGEGQNGVEFCRRPVTVLPLRSLLSGTSQTNDRECAGPVEVEASE